MITGPLARETVAEYLGVRPEDVARLIKEDGLPAIIVPTKTRPAEKVTLLGLHRWLINARRYINVPPTLEDLELELERAAKQVGLRRQATKAAREEVCS